MTKQEQIKEMTKDLEEHAYYMEINKEFVKY